MLANPPNTVSSRSLPITAVAASPVIDQLTGAAYPESEYVDIRSVSPFNTVPGETPSPTHGCCPWLTSPNPPQYPARPDEPDEPESPKSMLHAVANNDSNVATAECLIMREGCMSP